MSRRVSQNIVNEAAKYCLRLADFDSQQGVERLLPTSPPEANLLSPQPDRLADGPIEQAAKCQ
jgi:hypothetical protein